VSRAREGAREGGRGREIAREAAVFSQPNFRRMKDVGREEKEGKNETGTSVMDGKKKEKENCELKPYRRGERCSP